MNIGYTIYSSMRWVIALFSIGFFSLTISGQNISFCQSSLSFPEVKNADFLSLEGDLTINNGYGNGFYWIKVEHPGDNIARVIELPYTRLKNPKIYSGSGDAEIIRTSFYIEFHLPASEEVREFYIQVEAFRPAYIPVKIRTADDFRNYQNDKMLRLGMYYGFALCVILFNLLFWFYFREPSFGLYVFFLIVISSNLAVEDGILSYWQVPWALGDFIDTLLHWCVPFACALFTWDYMQFHSMLPEIKWPLRFMLGLSAVLYISYHIGGGIGASAWADTTAVMALFIIQIGGLLIFKKSVFARIFVLAYSVILLFAFDLYVPKHFGFTFLGLSSDFLKIGGVIEMLVFSVAVVFRMNKLKQDNEFYKQEIRNMMIELEQAAQVVMKADTASDPDETLPIDLSKEFKLTKRQSDILGGIQRGLSNQEIADELFISLNTVKYHTKNIYEKLGVKRRTQLMTGNQP